VSASPSPRTRVRLLRTRVRLRRPSQRRRSGAPRTPGVYAGSARGPRPAAGPPVRAGTRPRGPCRALRAHVRRRGASPASRAAGPRAEPEADTRTPALRRAGAYARSGCHRRGGTCPPAPAKALVHGPPTRRARTRVRLEEAGRRVREVGFRGNHASPSLPRTTPRPVRASDLRYARTRPLIRATRPRVRRVRARPDPAYARNPTRGTRPTRRLPCTRPSFVPLSQLQVLCSHRGLHRRRPADGRRRCSLAGRRRYRRRPRVG
jgi:hypothetical protein